MIFQWLLFWIRPASTLCWLVMLGLFKEMSPRFLKVYVDLQQATVSAVTQFREEVESGQFPTDQYSYGLADQDLDKLQSQLGG